MHKYSINVVWSEEDECYIATIPEFEGLSAFGDTQQEAIKEALVALEGFAEVYQEDNVPLPKPNTYTPHSGQTRLRLPKSLHAALVVEANQEGVSLNSYINKILAERHEQGKADILLEKIDELQDAVLTLCRATFSSFDESQTVSSNWIEYEYMQLAGKYTGRCLSELYIPSSEGSINYGTFQNLCMVGEWQSQRK